MRAREKELVFRTTAVAWIVLCMAIVAALYLGREAVSAWFSKDSAPAWVQAIGSIAAILAAFLISRHQISVEHRRQAEMERIAFIERCEKLGAITLNFHNFLDGLIGKLTADPEFAEVAARHFGQAAPLVTAITLLEVPAALVQRFARIQMSAVLVINYFERGEATEALRRMHVIYAECAKFFEDDVPLVVRQSR